MEDHPAWLPQESVADLGIADHAAFHAAANDGDPVYSDLVGYFTKVSPLPHFLQFLLFNAFLIQWMVSSFLITLKDFWMASPTFFRAIRLFSYISLVHAPTMPSPSFLPLMLTLISLYILSNLTFICLRAYYARHSYLPRWLSYVFIIVSFFLHTLLLPTFFAFGGSYLRATFYNDPSTSSSIAVLVALLLGWQTYDSVRYLLFKNCQIDLQTGLFLCRKPTTAARLYLSLAIISFTSHIIPTHWHSDIIIPTIAFLINLINLICELAQMSWLIRWQFSLTAAVCFGGMFSTAGLFVSAVFPSVETDPRSLAMLSIVSWALGWVLFPFLHRLVLRSVMNRLSDPEYPKKVRSAFWVHRDFHLGLQFGHPAVLQSTYVAEILDRFPNDFELHLFLANFSLSCQTCPKTLAQLAERVRPGNKYSPFRAHVFNALGKLLPPTSQSEREAHARKINELNQLFSNMIVAESQLYDMIFNEQAGGVIPEAALRFRYFYDRTVHHLTRFL
jgi:hypothetical protein